MLNEENRVGLLQLTFADTADPQRDDAITTFQATEILDFAESIWDQVDAMLIHCEAGLSRSPAIAAALTRIHYGDDGPWFEMDFPNRLVYQTLLAAHTAR